VIVLSSQQHLWSSRYRGRSFDHRIVARPPSTTFDHRFSIHHNVLYEKRAAIRRNKVVAD
jgi:hypothetical protein